MSTLSLLFPDSCVRGTCRRRSGHPGSTWSLPPFSLPPLHSFTKTTSFCFRRESMASHINHTSEGGRAAEPLAQTRAPTLSLYKSNSLEGPEKESPGATVERYPIQRAWVRHWALGSEPLPPSTPPPSLQFVSASPPCEVYSTGQANWEFPEHNALMEA